mmetsp:Transcript_11949/g.13106  ORF Transcript_11949/g.13106 Transcript_11949/m.13106 type:complete len:255 (-) Transcript_11949:160-924(-)
MYVPDRKAPKSLDGSSLDRKSAGRVRRRKYVEATIPNGININNLSAQTHHDSTILEEDENSYRESRSLIEEGSTYIREVKRNESVSKAKRKLLTSLKNGRRSNPRALDVDLTPKSSASFDKLHNFSPSRITLSTHNGVSLPGPKQKVVFTRRKIVGEGEDYRRGPTSPKSARNLKHDGATSKRTKGMIEGRASNQSPDLTVQTLKDILNESSAAEYSKGFSVNEGRPTRKEQHVRRESASSNSSKRSHRYRTSS